jgi:hypothetical protein
MLHEPLNELDSGLVLGDLAAWLSARLGNVSPLPGGERGGGEGPARPPG